MRDRVASTAALYHKRNRFVRGSRSTLTYGWKHRSSAAVTTDSGRRTGWRITRRMFRSSAMRSESTNTWTPAGRDRARSSLEAASRLGEPTRVDAAQRPPLRNSRRSALIEASSGPVSGREKLPELSLGPDLSELAHLTTAIGSHFGQPGRGAAF